MNETFSHSENSVLRAGEISAGDFAEAVLEFYVEGEDDLVGLLAYALYERQKRDFVVGHRRRNGGRSPGEAEIAAINSNYLSNDLRNTLRDRASQILSGYAETYVEAMEPQIQVAAVNSEALRQARDIESSLARRSGFWRQVRVAFVVSLLMILLFSGAFVAAVLFHSNIVDAWDALTVPTLRT
jgi:hypothetical protein